jgi:hypothetical protein
LQTRVLIHTYKLLLLLAKAHQLPKSAANRALPPEFDSLASMVNRDLTHRVYHFMIDDQEVNDERALSVSLFLSFKLVSICAVCGVVFCEPVSGPDWGSHLFVGCSVYSTVEFA